MTTAAGASTTSIDEPHAVMVAPTTCCCGHSYTEYGGESGDRYLISVWQLCAECATGGKGCCPTHRVQVQRT